MTLKELFPSIQSLSHSDKIRLMRLLATDVAREEGVDDSGGKAVAIWSPHGAFEGASTLLKVLEHDGAAS